MGSRVLFLVTAGWKRSAMIQSFEGSIREVRALDIKRCSLLFWCENDIERNTAGDRIYGEYFVSRHRAT